MQLAGGINLARDYLLAFEIAIERSHPGAIMAGYNMVNGTYAGGDDVTLNQVLKGAWGYPGWVMSDWGATKSWEFALAGLDQECGVQIDVRMWGAEQFTGPLTQAYEDGAFPKQRLSDMARRILLYLTGAAGDPRMRLLGFERVELEPGESRQVTVTADRRLLARFDGNAGRWHIEGGSYGVAVGRAADALDLTAETTLTEALFGS